MIHDNCSEDVLLASIGKNQFCLFTTVTCFWIEETYILIPRSAEWKIELPGKVQIGHFFSHHVSIVLGINLMYFLRRWMLI
jgi:hypothetical protein